MRTNPNYIPMSPRAVRRIVEMLQPFAFDRLYGSQWPKMMKADAEAALIRSSRRYLRAIEAEVRRNPAMSLAAARTASSRCCGCSSC